MKKYVSLHNHFSYSLMDGIGYPEERLKYAKTHGMEAMSITDHGSMAGTFDFYTSAIKVGIKPLLGIEGYHVDDSNVKDKDKEKENRSHIILIAKNMVGYQLLLKALYRANTTGFYSKPRFDWKDLESFNGNVICISACSGGIVAKNLNNPKVDNIIERLKDIFHDDLYMEYVALGRVDYYKPIWEACHNLANKHNLKSVITGDVHYLHKTDWKLQQVLHNINNDVTVEEMKKHPEKGWQMSDKDLYLKTYDEIVNIMKNIFPLNKVEEFLNNTIEVSNKCEKYSILPDHYVFPKVEFDVNEMKNKIKLNLVKKCPQDKIKQYQDRVKYEWGIIEKMGFVPYFYIVADMISWAKENNILVGPARGSCSGSLITYLLDITEIDPIKFNLSFERFVNPTRCLHPDTLVKAKTGIKKIKDININDKVLTLDSLYYKVIGKNINSINEEIINIKYDNGNIKCTKNHKFLIFRDYRFVEVLADELLLTDKLLKLIEG